MVAAPVHISGSPPAKTVVLNGAAAQKTANRGVAAIALYLASFA
jgi:hypothetical protein